MSAAIDSSLHVAEPTDLAPRRRFSKLGHQEQRALAREVQEAAENHVRLRMDFYARNPRFGVTG